MAFKLIARDIVQVPVKGVLANETGKAEPFDFSLTCRRLGADAMRDQLKAGGERSLKEFMAPLVQGWRGVLDAQGNAVDFNPDALDALLDTPGLAALVFESYAKEQAAREKN